MVATDWGARVEMYVMLTQVECWESSKDRFDKMTHFLHERFVVFCKEERVWPMIKVYSRRLFVNGWLPVLAFLYIRICMGTESESGFYHPITMWRATLFQECSRGNSCGLKPPPIRQDYDNISRLRKLWFHGWILAELSVSRMHLFDFNLMFWEFKLVMIFIESDKHNNWQ